MAVQQQPDDFLDSIGPGVVAKAHAEHASKPVDTGNRRLPGGIRNGVAKLSSMYVKRQEKDGEGKIPKGAPFFRASATVFSPVEHDGEKVYGLTTQVLIPLCDTAPKEGKKGTPKSVSEYWFDFQNLFKLLGAPEFPEKMIEGPADSPPVKEQGKRVWKFYMNLMSVLVERSKTNPIWVDFSTRTWKPSEDAEEMVFETWHGLADPPENLPDPTKSIKTREAPTSPPSTPPATTTSTATTVVEPQVPTTTRTTVAESLEDKVESLIQTAVDNPELEEGAVAQAELERMATANGWTTEEFVAADWDQVANMALNAKSLPDQPEPAKNVIVTVGSKWSYVKRSAKTGEKLKNSSGEEFPKVGVEVVTLDVGKGVCTLKTVADNKDIIDIRTKKPAEVKIEWLEPYQS